MRFQLFSPEVQQARADFRAARERLMAITDREETDEYLDANSAVIEAEKPLKWWQRIDIELTTG